MKFLEGLISEECDAGVGDDAQNCRGKASVEGLKTFLLGNPHKDVHDVAVPVKIK